jgi:basic amino acid/polyamine antiporter, APA family
VTDAPPSRSRQIGFFAATGIGVGAIVGGGVLVLGGAAFGAAGPGAILAFALNGLVAAIAACSFAEMSTAFPESGGAYMFAKKILSVRAAFGVGWILWFAYIVAAVLYALGFAEYALAFSRDTLKVLHVAVPDWLAGRRAVIVVALVASAGYTLALARKASGGGQWATIGKLVAFAVLIVGGFIAFFGRQGDPAVRDLTPFLPHGFTGVVATMGLTFTALQGFELVANVAGDVENPKRNVPRAMFLSLGLALLVYLPLLFVSATAGTPRGTDIVRMSLAHPETVMAVAARSYLGTAGYVLVMLAAILSTLSALQASLFAASRVALTMATDRTLPHVLAQSHQVRKTPVMALYATLLAVASILFMVPNLAAAGGAAGLIFLVSFALAHWTAILARKRMPPTADGFRTPLFPLFPLIGMASCISLAAYQAFAVPAAGAITMVWLGLGGILYFSVFASRAEIVDAAAEGLDPRLMRLRGRTPVVLVPVSNPQNAVGLVEVANALAPSEVGRVLLLTVMKQPNDAGTDAEPALDSAQGVLREALRAAIRAGHTPEALMTISSEPWSEIERIARARESESILLGLTRIGDSVERLESLLNRLECDVAVLAAPPGWRLDHAKRIVVPVGGRGSQKELRARLLSSLGRASGRKITFVRVMPADTDAEHLAAAKSQLLHVAHDEARGNIEVDVIASADPSGAVLERATDADLMILGLPRVRGKKLFGEVAIRIAAKSPGATIMLSRGR